MSDDQQPFLARGKSTEGTNFGNVQPTEEGTNEVPILATHEDELNKNVNASLSSLEAKEGLRNSAENDGKITTEKKKYELDQR